jgi:hypothetical protein
MNENDNNPICRDYNAHRIFCLEFGESEPSVGTAVAASSAAAAVAVYLNIPAILTSVGVDYKISQYYGTKKLNHLCTECVPIAKYN